MRYNPMQQYQADSPYSGRGLGVRHSGGGVMHTGMMGGPMDDPAAGYMPNQAGGLGIMDAQGLPPGAMYDVAQGAQMPFQFQEDDMFMGKK